MTTINDDMTTFFSGEKLFGDDFEQSDITKWYEDEENGYSSLGAENRSTYQYQYHALDQLCAYRYLNKKQYDHVLGLGSAYGEEFVPIMDKITDISIVDVADAFAVDNIHGKPISYFKAVETGTLPFENDSFNLVTCFSVLHHIPNISYVVGEIYRCMKLDGIALIREPTVSMGDWRKPRHGLTKRERGIPRDIMRSIFRNAGFTIENETNCVFPLTSRISNIMGIPTYDNKLITQMDKLLSSAFNWNYSYHRTSFFRKIAPAAAFWVLKK